MISDQVTMWLNGERRVVAGAQTRLPVAVWLREHVHLHGTKVACGTGDCGACTVLVAEPSPDTADPASVSWKPINSCVHFVFQLHGCHVVTVEGLSSATTLAPAQRAMIACHASQCGFCTPGFALTMTAALEDAPAPVVWRDALAGNVCRCTGYQAIVDAAAQAATLAQAEGEQRWLHHHFPAAQWQPQASAVRTQSLTVAGIGDQPEATLYRPASLADALTVLQRAPRAHIVAGATDLGVDGLDPARPVISIAHLPELSGWTVERASLNTPSAPPRDTLVLGAMTRWDELPKIFERTAGVHAPQLSAMVARVGGPQIRAAGTVGGNIMTASPIGDLLPLLLVLDASVEFRSSRATRVVAMHALAQGYRVTDRHPDELLTRVFVPLPLPEEQLRFEKVSRRYDVDLATVSLAARWRDDRGILRDVHLAVGGMGPVAMRLSQTEAVLSGQPSAAASWAAAAVICSNDVSPQNDLRGSAAYRSLVLQTLMAQLHRAPEASA